MKPKFLLATVIFVAMAAPAMAQHSHTSAKGEPAHGKEAAKTVAMTGEVIDLTCFMQHPANATGTDHAKCAKMCINKGLPIGFLDESGTMYLLVGGDHEPIAPMVADIAGQKVTINGIVLEQNGVKAIQLVSVEKTK